MKAPLGTPGEAVDDEVDDYLQVKALFGEVCDLSDEASAGERLRALNAAPALVERVLALVRQDAANRTRFSAPIGAMANAAAAPELAAGDVLGPWRLVEPAGEGGMGLVFRAERRDGHYEQRAAVKLLRGFGSAGALARLARERQILASLNHPNIARLVDGGTTPAGRPYLVMEYVDGLPLDVHCRTRGPAWGAVLELFTMVCDAVAYAHRNLVIHCDLKPGNVLVDGEGRAKLLDFGIAQLQGRDDDAPCALTPRYASPEQRAGGAGSIAGDVYSLGRILDELLEEFVLPGIVRREVQAIVGLACAEDPAQRYPGVHALIDDLHRLRRHEAVQAMGGAWPYRLRKGLRRQWPWAVAGTGVLALSVAFTLRLLHERDRALSAEAAAQREATTTREVSRLMASMFEGADPRRSGRPDVSAAAVVDAGRSRIIEQLAGRPEVQAPLVAVLGDVYQHMGRPRDAVAMYRQAVELAGRLRHPDEQAEALRNLASTLAEAGEAANAVEPASRALAIRRAAEPPDPVAIAAATSTLGYALSATGRYDEAARLLDEALALRRRLDGAGSAPVAHVLHLMGLLDRRRGRLEAAEAHFREAMQIRIRVLGQRDADTLASQQQLGTVLASLNRPEEAIGLLTDLLEQRRAIFGPDNTLTATALNELANALQDAGRGAEAIADYRAALEIEERLAGRPSMRLAVAANNLASALEDYGDLQAEALYRDSLAQRLARLPAGDLSVARARHNLGRWLLGQGRLAEARGLLESAYAARQAQLPPDHDERVASGILMAELELASGRTDAAQALLDGLAPSAASLRPVRRAALQRAQAILLAARGRSEEALQVRESALALLRENTAPRAPARLKPELELARLALDAGHADTARRCLAEAAPLLAAQLPSSPWRSEAARLRQRLAVMKAAG